MHWCKNSGVCPHCHECLDPETGIGPVRMLPLQIWSVLKIKCCSEINGCKETFGLTDSQKNPCKIMRRYAHSKSKKIKAVTSCSTHKIDQQETDG